jgi:stage IV sporulation protein FB
MLNPLNWSLPLGRVFGITVRIHLFFLVIAVGFILRAHLQKKLGLEDTVLPSGAWADAAMIMILLFFSVLLHEFGHCYAARRVHGEATEILLWPLGGLAFVEVPQTPRANFIVAAGGPAVNLVLMLGCMLALGLFFDQSYMPPWDPLTCPWRTGADGAVRFSTWSGGTSDVTSLAPILLARFFWVNWFTFLFNVCVFAFPLDGGRMFQCVLWRYLGYRQATLVAIFMGFVFAIVIAVYALVETEQLALCLALFIGVTCWQQRVMLETGGEESLFGYDFSQGYTSLERDHPVVAPRQRLNWYQRWSQRRAARKLQREQETREAEERRMDELLEKVQRHGLPALTDEERRFLKRVSDRYRNRH